MSNIINRALHIPEDIDIRLDGLPLRTIEDKELYSIKKMYSSIYSGELIQTSKVFHSDKEEELYRLILTAVYLGQHVPPVIWIKEISQLTERDMQYYLHGDIVLFKCTLKDAKSFRVFKELRRLYYGKKATLGVVLC